MPELSSTPEEQAFKDWLLNPVTKKLREAAERRKETLKEEWASGSFTAMEHFGTATLNAKAIGRVQELSWIIELDFTDLYEEMEIGLRPE
jgi:prophage antirepressor-like protein